jgi:hypothetical protein
MEAVVRAVRGVYELPDEWMVGDSAVRLVACWINITNDVISNSVVFRYSPDHVGRWHLDDFCCDDATCLEDRVELPLVSSADEAVRQLLTMHEARDDRLVSLLPAMAARRAVRLHVEMNACIANTPRAAIRTAIAAATGLPEADVLINGV